MLHLMGSLTAGAVALLALAAAYWNAADRSDLPDPR